MSRKLFVIPVAAAFVLAAGGCGTVVDNGKIEGQLTDQVEAAGVQVKGVECPSDVDAKKDEEFDCTVTTQKGTEVKLNGEVQNDDGEVKFDDADLQKLGATGAREQLGE